MAGKCNCISQINFKEISFVMDVKDIKISDYTYDLPEEKIAFYPLAQRDASKLMLYNEGKITDGIFSNIVNYLPANSLLVFNNSKVINARLQFVKPSGGIIEIFLLEPVSVNKGYEVCLSITGNATWNCFVGGASKWKDQNLEMELNVQAEPVKLYAEKISKGEETYEIKFSWEPATISFAGIIENAGVVPLPPYIKRKAETTDENRYQTVYASAPGSVAAPTAGLHFTKKILEETKKKNIKTCEVTLHVGAGTFKPVKAEKMESHPMHSELLEITLLQVNELLQASEIIAVGTTSLRTLETIYHIGTRILAGNNNLEIKQWDVYNEKALHSRQESLLAVKLYLEKTSSHKIFIKTQILIAPGYRFQMVDYLVTNFHQPQSTLLLLVAAAVGENWRSIYKYALENEYRFLSYGDASLIKIEKS